MTTNRIRQKTKTYHHGDLREALLRSAESILKRDGLGALSLRAAARAAGVSHAAPAHHFPDLCSLLSALAAEGFDRLSDKLMEEILHLNWLKPTSRSPKRIQRCFN
jgi:AcrR family transcriptional regulator